MGRLSKWKQDAEGNIYNTDYFVLDVSTKHISVIVVASVALVCLVLLFAMPSSQIAPDSDAVTTLPSVSVPSQNIPSYFSYDGFLFPYSSTTRLSTSEIRDLRNVAAANNESYRNLLRYAMNEIYARHGYQFDSGRRFDTFYSQFEWYRSLPKQTTVSWAEFNETERYNLGLILAEEEKNGYR